MSGLQLSDSNDQKLSRKNLQKNCQLPKKTKATKKCFIDLKCTMYKTI